MLKKTNVLLAPITLLLLLSFILGGCASQTGNSFSPAQARQANAVSFGTITLIERATIEKDSSLLGAAGGAVVGGVAGSTLGGGSGRTLFTLGGAVVGALAGAGIEKAVNTTNAVEIGVRLDNGQTITVVQELGDEERAMRIGHRVRVLRASDGSARVRLGTGEQNL